METRFLLIYLNDENEKCVRVLTPDKISEVMTNDYSPALDRFLSFEGYDEFEENEIVVHQIAPSVGDILNFDDVDPTAWSIYFNLELLTVSEFMEAASLADDIIFKLYNNLSSSIKEIQKPH